MKRVIVVAALILALVILIGVVQAEVEPTHIVAIPIVHSNGDEWSFLTCGPFSIWDPDIEQCIPK